MYQRRLGWWWHALPCSKKRADCIKDKKQKTKRCSKVSGKYRDLLFKIKGKPPFGEKKGKHQRKEKKYFYRKPIHTTIVTTPVDFKKPILFVYLF